MIPTGSLEPVVILVEPQMGENIGSAARSMLNFGLTDLRIINPRDGWPNPKAVDMAKNAKEVIKNAQIYQKLEDALHDIHNLLATTARPRHMVKQVMSPKEAALHTVADCVKGKKTALMFGPERSGLENQHITLANAIISVDVSHLYSSLNLAQAVTVIAYEYFAHKNPNKAPETQEDQRQSPNASRQEIAHMLTHLEQELDKSDFFKLADKKPKMLNNIRNIFTRIDLTSQEVRTIRGIIKSLTKS